MYSIDIELKETEWLTLIFYNYHVNHFNHLMHDIYHDLTSGYVLWRAEINMKK